MFILTHHIWKWSARCVVAIINWPHICTTDVDLIWWENWKIIEYSNKTYKKYYSRKVVSLMLTENCSNKCYGKHRNKFKRHYSTYIMHSRDLLKIVWTRERCRFNNHFLRHVQVLAIIGQPNLCEIVEFLISCIYFF